ncbi:hypothetical protein V2J09_009278 [Rumex salicifolius]
MDVMKRSSLEANALIGMILALFLFLNNVTGQVIGQGVSFPTLFDVTKFGAISSGKPEMDEYGEDAFIQTWVKACRNVGPSKVVIPRGKFVVSQVIFNGPCNGGAPIVDVQGQVVANPDLSLYSSPEWFTFENVDNVILKGSGGSLNGQGQLYYPINDCLKNPKCSPGPSSIKLYKANKSLIEGVRSMNSMFFHVSVVESTNVTIRNVQLDAPIGSPNTEGVHIVGSRLVKVVDSIIKTGAECVSICPDSSNVSITGVICGPGLGVGIAGLGGSLNDNRPVRRVNVNNCTFKQSENGVILKTLPGLVASTASEINVKNPIIIDQGQVGAPSHVKIKDVTFKKIIGTSSSNSVISIHCSQILPCEEVQVIDVNVKPIHQAPKPLASCYNAKVGILSHLKIKNVTFNKISGTLSSNFVISFYSSQILQCKEVNLIDTNVKPINHVPETLASCSNAKVVNKKQNKYHVIVVALSIYQTSNHVK